MTVATFNKPVAARIAPASVDALAAVGIGLAAAAAPIAVDLVSPALGALTAFAAALLIALAFERGAPVVLLTMFAFQNTAVAFASPYAAGLPALETMKSADVIAAIGMWLVATARLARDFRALPRLAIKLHLVTTVALALVGVDFIWGLTIDPRNAAVYARNIGLPLVFFQIAFGTALRRAIPLRAMLTALFALVMACGYLELASLQTWLALTHGGAYWDLILNELRASPRAAQTARETGFVAGGALDLLRSSFFNLDVGPGSEAPLIVRLQGPNFHVIGFGYLLASLALFAAAHARLGLAALAIPLLLFAGAKGALALLGLGLAFLAAARVSRSAAPVAGLLVVLALYAAVAFAAGLRSGDYHVLGFLGGFSGFLQAPLGHSLGAGGNLSTDFENLDWSRFQAEGRADVAVESALGVLLFQMGVGAAALVGVYGWIAAVAWRLHRRLHAPALALGAGAILVTLVNGVFQEEAMFSPLALGVVMLMAGLALGASLRIAPA